MDKEKIIYLALSNLIANSLDSLEGIKKLPLEQRNEDDIKMLEYIISQAEPLEEEYRKIIQEEPIHIERPNWDEMQASE